MKQPSSRAKTVDQGRRVRGQARLIVLGGPQAGRRCELPEKSIIGRHIDSPIVLEDAGVSRRHAEIRRAGDGAWEIEDLESQNGVRLNGLPVQQSEIFIGDKIQLGPHVLLLFTDRGAVEDELIERQKLELLGRVAVGIAHDFNNVLGVLAASASYLRSLGVDGSKSPREAEGAISDIEAAVANGARLANRLVGFARGSQQGRSAIDVSKLCREVAQMCQRFFSSAIRLEVDVEPGLFVLADQGELEQVLMNLCVNARDAMQKGGVVTLRARRRLLEEVDGERLAAPTAHVVLSVRDTGSGIEPINLGRIFEPFFTTKASGAGFGVGLATVKELVTLHGGAIEVESARGSGTTFHVKLPAVGQEVRSPRPQAPTAPTTAFSGAGLRVLLVDDDLLVRRSVKRLLTRIGCEVVEASGGAEALEIYTRGPRPSFVLLDLEMPGLSGLEVLTKLLELDPGAHVLVASGHREPAKEQAVRAAGGAFLGKPFNSAELTAAVEALVEGGSRPQQEDMPTLQVHVGELRAQPAETHRNPPKVR